MAAIELVASGAHPSGVTAAVDTSAITVLKLTLDVTAARSNPQLPPRLAVTLETSADSTTWRTLHEFPDSYGVVQHRVVVSPDDYVRVRWTEQSPEVSGWDGSAYLTGFEWSLSGTSL